MRLDQLARQRQAEADAVGLGRAERGEEAIPDVGGAGGSGRRVGGVALGRSAPFDSTATGVSGTFGTLGETLAPPATGGGTRGQTGVLR